MSNSLLIKKYNVAAPRYTSYPTVPHWQNETWAADKWIDSVVKSYDENGISLYIHLPFCESLCTYCGCTTRITKNHQVELPYIHAVLKEWSIYRQHFTEPPLIKEVHLGGGTPTFFSAENLGILIEGIRKNARFADDCELSFEAHPANTSDEHLQTLHKLGFRRLSLGIQDFDPIVQEIINRKQTVADVERVCINARNLGYTSINFDLIYGLPLQKMAGIKQTIREVIRLQPDRIAYYSYAHVPWLKPGQRRFTELDLPEDDIKRALYERGCEMLTDAGYHNIGMDHFALNSDTLTTAARYETLHRNFMGYTHKFTRLTIGLGTSSISDSWLAFAQNEKSVEQYISLVSNGQLPLVKGHLLSDEDLIIRKLILNIMCLGKTRVSSAIPGWIDTLVNLQPLINDKLIVLENDLLQVTEAGKPFLRNVCMCFDLHLRHIQPAFRLFSTSV